MGCCETGCSFIEDSACVACGRPRDLSDDDVLDLVGAAAKENSGRVGTFEWQRSFARLVTERALANFPSIPKRHGLPDRPSGQPEGEGDLAVAQVSGENLSEEVAAGSTPVAGTLTRDQFYSELMVLLAEHPCDSWKPRCKQCDRQEQAKDKLLIWFDSKTTALELANEHRQRLIARQHALVAALGGEQC